MTFENELRIEIGQAVRSLQLLTSEFQQYNKQLDQTAKTITRYNTSAEAIGENVAKSLNNLRKEEKSIKQKNAALREAIQLGQQNLKIQQATSAVRSAFGPVSTVGSGLSQVQSFDQATAAFDALVAKSEVSQKRVKAILANLGASYKGAEARIRDAIVNILRAQAQLKGPSGAAARATLEGLEGPVKRIKDRAQEVLVTWKSVQRIFLSQVIFRTLTTINSELRESVRLARDIEKAIAEVRTIAPEELVGDPGRIQDFTSNLSSNFGIDQVEVATALYEAFSNQVGGTADAFFVLEEAAKFSKATLTDLADTQDLLSGVLNAYGLSAANARDISDQLFKTIDLGRVRGEEIANTYGRILPLAAQLGVGFDEVNAALATTTIQGVKADTALTQIQNIMKALIKPTDDLQKRFDDLGVSGAEAGIAQFGLVGFLKQITTESDSVQELSKFFGDIRELRGVLGVLAQEGELFEKSLKGIRDEAAGVVDEASQIVLETDTEQLERAQQTIRNLFAEDFGAPVVKILNGLIETVGGAENAARILFSVMAAGATTAAGLIGGQLVFSIGQATVRMFSLQAATGGAASAMTGLALAAGTFAALGLGLYIGQLIGDLERGATAAQKIAGEFEQASRIALESSKRTSAEEANITRAFEDEIRDRTGIYLDYLSRRNIEFKDAEDNALRSEENITRNLNKQVDQRVTAVRRYIDAVEKSISDADSNINRLVEEDQDISFRLNRDRFSRDLAGTSDFFKPDALKRRVGQLLAASQKAFREGNVDFSKQLNEEAFRVATQLAEITGERRRGEQLLNQVVLARQKINQVLIDQEQQKAEQAQRQVQALENQAASIEKVATKFEDLIEALRQDLITDEQREKLQRDLEATGAELQTLFSNFAGEGLQGLEGELDKIQAKFRDFEGGEVPLDFLISESLDRVNAELKTAQFSAELALVVQEITGIEQGRNQIDNLQTRIATLLTDSITLQKNLKGAANALNTRNEFQDRALGIGDFTGLQDLLLSVVKATEQQARIADAFKNAPGLRGAFEFERLDQFEDALTKLVAIEKQIKANDFKGAQDGVNALAADENLNNLTKINQALQGLPAALRALNEPLTEAANAQVDAQGFEELRIKAQDARFELEGIQNVIQQDALNTDIEIDISIDETRIRQQIDSLRQAIQQLDSQISAAGAGTVQGRSRGGLIYRANGGWVPRGTDKIPAMLSAGEFVVNAASSRKFYSELMAINSGRAPMYRQSGGPVTNNTTSVGDITVNVTSSGPANGRQIAQDIRRELRRNTSRL